MSEIKKIIVYMRDGGTYRIKKDFALFRIDGEGDDRRMEATADLNGQDNLMLLKLYAELITNSVLPNLPPIHKGAAYMQVINTLRSCTKKIWDEHQDDIADFMRTEIAEATKPRIILPGEGQLQ